MGLSKRGITIVGYMASRIIIILFTCLFLFSSAPVSDAYMLGRDIFSNNIPQPILKEPIADKVDLSGKSELVFRWSPHEGNISQRKHYDFRLYEGYQMIETSLILKENVSANKHQITVSTDTFKANQVYTWSLRQVYRAGKSRRSTSSFTVTGK
jgi:hypothetical protein